MKMPELPEANDVADQLLEIIKQHYRKIHGQALESKDLLKEATEVIKRRLP